MRWVKIAAFLMNQVYQVLAKLGILELFRSEKTSRIIKPSCLLSTHTIGPGPLIWPVQIPVQSLPTLQQTNTPAQLGFICRLAEGALASLIQGMDKDTEQDWPKDWAQLNWFVSSHQLDVTPFSTTLWTWTIGQSFIQEIVHLSRPRASGFCRIIQWDMVSEALLKCLGTGWNEVNFPHISPLSAVVCANS